MKKLNRLAAAASGTKMEKLDELAAAAIGKQMEKLDRLAAAACRKKGSRRRGLGRLFSSFD